MMAIKYHGQVERLEDNLVIKKKLGQGSYGRVFLAVDRKTGEEVAAKLIELSASPHQKRSSIEEIAAEIELLRDLPLHEHICQFRRSFETESQVAILLEVCGDRNLLEHLRSSGLETDEPVASRFMRQALLGYQALHAAGIYHIDVKLTNMMVRDGRVKLIDFGMSVAENRPMRFVGGADGYYGREMYLRFGYLPEMTDIWSFGVAVYKLVFGAYPFGQEKQVGRAHQDKKRFRQRLLDLDYGFPQDKQPSDELRDFLSKIFVPEKQRWTASQLLEHPWITKYQ